MADLTALRRAHAAGLAGAVGREVVVVHVALAIDGLDGVEALTLVEHTEREHREHLGLTALEQAGAVNQRQVVALDHDGADLGGGAAVDALTSLDNHATHGGLLELLEVHRDLALPNELLLLGELGLNGLLELGDLVLTGQLVGVAQGGGHLVVMGEDAVVDLLDRLVERVLALNDRAVGALPLLDELELGVAESADGLLAELHGGEHVLLGDLLGAGLDHGDEVTGARELEVEIGVLALLIGGVDDELAGLLVAADTHAGQRTLERHAADGHGEGGAHDADHVDGVLLIGHEGGGNDLDLVAEAVGEGRADWTVDHASSEGGLLGGTALTLEIAARDAAGSVHLLVEVDGQREEVVVLALLGNDDRGEHGGVALLDERGAGGLLGELADLENVGLTEQVEGLAYECHEYSYPHAPLARGLL